MESRSRRKKAKDPGIDTSVPAPKVGGETSLSIPPEFKLELFSRKATRQEDPVYTEELGMMICGFIAQNTSMSVIASLPGMPSVLEMKRWLKTQPKFAELMKTAEEARAEILADNALAVAAHSQWQDAKSDKLRIDVALRLAAAYDPNKFAAKQKISSEHHETLTFFINTGFEHPGESRRLKPISIETRDPSLVLKEEHERNSHRLPSPSGPVDVEVEAEEKLSDRSSPPSGKDDLLPEQHD